MKTVLVLNNHPGTKVVLQSFFGKLALNTIFSTEEDFLNDQVDQKFDLIYVHGVAPAQVGIFKEISIKALDQVVIGSLFFHPDFLNEFPMFYYWRNWDDFKVWFLEKLKTVDTLAKV